MLIQRDIRARYKQTALGIGWVVAQPVLSTAVFTLVLGRLVGVSTQVDGHYVLFAFTGLVVWGIFSSSTNKSGQSLLNNSRLISRVDMPRILLPVAAALSSIVDFVIMLGVLAILLLMYDSSLGLTIFLMPLFAVAAVVASLAVGIPLSIGVVYMRDLRHAMTFALQLWMFATPVAYPVEFVPDSWRLLYSLNPMVGVTSGFRSAVLNQPIHWGVVSVSFASIIVLLLCGTWIFERFERRVPEIL